MIIWKCHVRLLNSFFRTSIKGLKGFPEADNSFWFLSCPKYMYTSHTNNVRNRNGNTIHRRLKISLMYIEDFRPVNKLNIYSHCRTYRSIHLLVWSFFPLTPIRMKRLRKSLVHLTCANVNLSCVVFFVYTKLVNHEIN